MKKQLFKITSDYFFIDKTIHELLLKDDYINDNDLDNIDNLIKRLKDDVKVTFINKIIYYDLYKDYKYYKTIYKKQSKTLKKDIDKHNDDIALKKIDIANAIIGKIEGNYLDNNQLNAIVRENNNHLVLAGAGTGKTTTIIGKVKYLLKNNMCTKDEILLLSFTSKSAKEMKERIKKEINETLDVFTFHKLGLEIIKKYSENNIKITNITLINFIKNNLLKLTEDYEYLTSLITFILYHRIPYKDEFTFKNIEEYINYKKNYPLVSINEEVLNYGELYIANYLFQHNIRYEYNKNYSFDNLYNYTFYLIDYNLYIEYYEIDRNNKVPPYMLLKNNNANDIYNDIIKHKRKIHKKNNSKVIECYQYELSEGIMLTKLGNKLDSYNVIKKIDSNKTFKEILKLEPDILNGITLLFETVINLLKSNNYSINEARNVNLNEGLNVRDNDIILSLIEPILDNYNNYLKVNNEIDFNDMINIATYYIKKYHMMHNYKYVIVDEYQDISYSRYNLLKALRDNNFYKLFCVGDDFQSIYRFSGSDIGLIINFSRYYGRSYISKIKKTYRFSNKLVEISNNFILKNPKQLKKDIIGRTYDLKVLGIINGKSKKSIVSSLEEKLKNIKSGSKVFFLGRYTNDIKILDESNNFIYDSNISGNMDIIYKGNKDIKIEFLTIHRSKGLQADYVFILNNKRRGMGFPSNIIDLPIIYMLLDNSDDFKYSEERRLFYVALTRAKYKVYLLVVDNDESVFVKELLKDYGNYIEQEKNECPICGGKLVKKNGDYGSYYICCNHDNGCNYIIKYK